MKIRTDFVWSKGKKSPTLKAIDSDAKAAAHQPWKRDYGFREGKIGRSKVKQGRTAASLFVAKGQKAVVHAYRKVLVKGVDRIDFDLYDETKATFISKCRAYAELSLGVELQRGHVYKVRFNDVRQYPRIEVIIEEIPKQQLEPPTT